MKTEEKILHHLSRHPRLTAEQLARVVTDNLKVHMKGGKEYPNNLSNVTEILKRMASKRDGRGKPKPVLVKAQAKKNLNEPWLWMLPATEKIRDGKYYHELAKGDLYVAYARRCDDWQAEKSFGDLVTDCSMTYRGISVHFEVDRATEAIDKLYDKIERYIHYAPHTDKTIFVLDDGPKRLAKTTGNLLYSYLSGRKRGRQFSWTRLSLLVKEPFGQWLFNPLQNEPLSIDELCSTLQGS